jgi:hypothetical protein
MQAGKKNRSVGATLMNATSSRSHSIFTVVIECGESDDRGDHIRVGKLNLVDLAGSERQSKVRTIQSLLQLSRDYLTLEIDRRYWRPFEGSHQDQLIADGSG